VYIQLEVSHSPGKPGKLLEICQRRKLLNFMLDQELLVW